MASATGIPEANPAADGSHSEEEPLLGRPGDASQPDGKGLELNFILGTGIIAQAGIWILVATVWVAVLKAPIMPFFTPHPLLNSAGLLLIIQGILLLQPTHTPRQKRKGTHIHATLNGGGVIFLLLALVIIEINKFDHGAPHFTSAHGRLGLITYILFVIQALVGLTQFYFPKLYGSVDNAKAVYKYHRVSGYFLVVFSLATVAAATQTGFNVASIHIPLWVVIVTSLIILAGLLPRVKKQKLGF